MGKYDFGKASSASCQLTILDLCEELIREFEEKHPRSNKGWRDKETLRKLFSNNDRSGLIDKLKDNLNYDIEALSSTDKSEKFAKLKLLKELYYIEKAEKSKRAPLKADELRIQITDILAKPRMENILTEFSHKSTYGLIVQKLLQKVASEVYDADKRAEKLERVNAYWEYIVDKTLDYVISDRALDEPQLAIVELDRLNGFLKEKVLTRLANIPNDVKRGKEDVMGTFYNILICHKFICNDVDRLNINYRICVEPPPSEMFSSKMKELEKLSFSWDSISRLENYNFIEQGDLEVKEFLQFVMNDSNIIRADEKNFRFAMRNFKSLLNLWVKAPSEIGISESVSADTVVILLQELISVYKHKEGFKNDYLGHNNPKRSLSAAIKKPHKADAVALQAWVKKLENRTAVNFGGYELIKKKREIENTLFQIKQIIYSYQNIDDLEFANRILSHLAARAIISREYAMQVGDRFSNKICEQLNENVGDIQFVVGPKSANVYDMFREFTIDKYNIEDLVAKDIARQINDFYATNDGVIRTGMRCDFEVCTSETCCRDFLLTFTVDKETNQCYYQQFVEVSPNLMCERMEQIGLGQFYAENYPMFF